MSNSQTPRTSTHPTSANQPHFRRALFVRMDRIGDLVLSLPTDESLAIDRVDWWIPPGLSFITTAAVPPRNATETSKVRALKECFKLAREVREKHYDFAVIFHAPWWVSFVIWLARIPIRIGVQSQWHSFLFLNRGVRQKRSRAEHSELEYGFQLLEQGLGLPVGRLCRSTLKMSAPGNQKSGPQNPGASGLEAGSLRHGLPAQVHPQDYFVVHPGMGGSALNWSTDRYADLIHELAHEKKVAITGTASDEAFLAPLRKKLAHDDDLHSKLIWLDGKLSGSELLRVLANARAVIAPSTGVLHLAASLGVPTIGLFSQVTVQRSVRWGPQGARVAIVEAPAEVDPALSMELIEVPQVLKTLHALLSAGGQ